MAEIFVVGRLLTKRTRVYSLGGGYLVRVPADRIIHQRNRVRQSLYKQDALGNHARDEFWAAGDREGDQEILAWENHPDLR